MKVPAVCVHDLFLFRFYTLSRLFQYRYLGCIFYDHLRKITDHEFKLNEYLTSDCSRQVCCQYCTRMSSCPLVTESAGTIIKTPAPNRTLKYVGCFCRAFGSVFVQEGLKIGVKKPQHPALIDTQAPQEGKPQRKDNNESSTPPHKLLRYHGGAKAPTRDANQAELWCNERKVQETL